MPADMDDPGIWKQHGNQPESERIVGHLIGETGKPAARALVDEVQETGRCRVDQFIGDQSEVH